jgi:mannitol/fructose-specific phosphotransferase system IIA component (Ntr-type)/NhaP-type Na+/H+ or K+/H+ antiporter
MDLQHMKFQILCLGLVILSAYIGGLIARKLKIGEVIGQIFGGLLVGPHFLLLIKNLLNNYNRMENLFIFRPLYHFLNHGLAEYTEIFENYHFFVFLFLGIIAFSLGEELHRDRIRKVGIKAIYICVLQAMMTWVLLSVGFHYIFRFTWINAFLIGSIGIATAPALIFILMNKLKIEGKLKSILANIVVLDDIIEVIFFSIFLSIAVSLNKGGEISFLHIAEDLFIEFALAILIGTLIFLTLKFTLKPKLSEDNNADGEETFIVNLLSKHSTPSVEVLLIIIGVIAIGISIAINYGLPFLITAVVAGFLISNFHSHAIFDSLKIGNVMPIFNLLFFGIIGSSVRLESFTLDSLAYIIGYIVLRSTGKIVGNYLGCKVTRQDPKVTACLPKLMLPQAGMAAVETILVLSVLPGAGGELIFNTIIPALVVFELGGAYLSEKTLLKWKTWITGEKEALKVGGNTVDIAGEFNRLVSNRAIPMHATTKEQAVFELARLIASEKQIKDISIITDPILEREKLSTTSMGNGIALPHCRSEFVDEVMIVCGVLENDINWETIDKKPVNLLFLIVSPKDQPDLHLQALRSISSLLIKPGFAENIRNSILQDKFEAFCKSLNILQTQPV